MQLMKSSALPAQVGQAHIQSHLRQEATTYSSTWGWLCINSHFLTISMFTWVPSVL